MSGRSSTPRISDARRRRRANATPPASAIASRLASTIEVAAIRPVRLRRPSCRSRWPRSRGPRRVRSRNSRAARRRARSCSRSGRSRSRGRRQPEHLVGIVAEAVVDRRLVELTDLRRHLLEARVARQLTAGRGLALRVRHGLLGLRALLRPRRLLQRELVAPVGAPPSPGEPPPSTRPNTSCHSSVTISSAVRVDPSRTRTRPDSEMSAAVRGRRSGWPAAASAPRRATAP